MNSSHLRRLAVLTLAWFPTSCGSVFLATQAQEDCMDEGAYLPECSRVTENVYWILAIVLTVAFIWALDRANKKRNEN